MQFIHDNDLYKIVRITGSTHNLLIIRLSEIKCSTQITKLQVKQGDIERLDEQDVLTHVLTGLEEVNQKLGKNYFLSEVQYVPSDTEPTSVYSFLIMELIKRIDLNGEFVVVQLGGFKQVRLALTASYSPRNYCVQHQEIDWDCICRLMEEEGIFYFFEKPSLSLLSSETANGAGARGDLEQYHYPGCYETPEEGKHYAQLRVDALNTFAFTATIKTNSQRLQPGYVMAIEGHPRNSANRQYLITHVHHKSQQPQSLEEGASTAAYSYQATVSLIPNDVTYRPTRVHHINKITGTETAIVTGPPGEEIYTDEHGRIKVHFHWDRNNGYDQKSSCWVRVSQAVAGSQWGSVSIPRVGEEVMIAYEAGLPDRPIVIGRLQNGQRPAPYPLPANKTRSSLKTLSTPNGGGFNEVRIEDKKSGSGLTTP